VTGAAICSAILLGSAFLCACTPNAKWEDTTGQGRPDEQRTADYRVCWEKAGFRPDGSRSVPFNDAYGGPREVHVRTRVEERVRPEVSTEGSFGQVMDTRASAGDLLVPALTARRGPSRRSSAIPSPSRGR